MNAKLLIIVAAVIVASVAPARAQCEQAIPAVSGAALTVSITPVVGGFQYAYSITNPVASTGCIYGASLDVSAPVAPTQLVIDAPLVATQPVRGGPIKVAPGHYTIAPGTAANGLVGGKIGAIVASFNLSVIGGVLGDTTLAYPGQTVALFTIISPNPPVKRSFTLFTVWDLDAAGTPFAIPDDVNVIGNVLGPAPTLVLDSDGDGVLDSVDACPNTPPGTRVDSSGCSSQQLVDKACPPAAQKNHGDYVSCVAHEADRQKSIGFITGDQQGQLVSTAANSDIGK